MAARASNISVYKYMTFRKSFFDDFRLKASRYGGINDPFDLVQGSLLTSFSDEKQEEFDRHVPEHFFDPTYWEEQYRDIQAGAKASLCVICFTELYDSLLMWSHYADSHRGVCVEYDYHSRFFHGEHACSFYRNVGTLTAVQYSWERPKLVVPSTLIDDTEAWFIKAKPWEYEKEHRLLLPLDDAIQMKIPNNAESLLLFAVSPLSIKRVLLGCRMEERNKRYVYQKMAYYGIKVVQATPDPSSYNLRFEDYDPNRSRPYSPAYNPSLDLG